MDKEFKKNLLSTSLWIRILYMIIFYIVSKVVFILILLIAVTEAVSKLVIGKIIEPVWNFSYGLNRYFLQIIDFLTFRTDDKPFPFVDWPSEKESFIENKEKNEKKINDKQYHDHPDK